MKLNKMTAIIISLIILLSTILPTTVLAANEIEETINNNNIIIEEKDNQENADNSIDTNKTIDNVISNENTVNENIVNENTASNEINKNNSNNILSQSLEEISNEELSKVKYNSHVQDYGWEEDFSKTDGELSGTEGKSKRIEAIKIALGNFKEITKNASIKYQVHVQDYGWMNWKQDGEIAGTIGESKRIETIKIKLENMEEYSVKYRVHVQDIGWTSWVQNGEIAGTVGQSKRIEAIQIKIVECPKIEMEYIYNEGNNTVTAIIHSNKQLADTKPTWVLSEDKLSYSKTFSENMDYLTQVQDIDGNKVDINIRITEIDNTRPKITIEYLYNQESNNVTVVLHSNKKLANTKPTWVLSEDALSYSKTFGENMDYFTTVTDIYGNIADVQIQINQIIEVEYIHNGENNTVTVIISSGRELADTKPTWILSSDKKSYSKTFGENMTYETPVTDIDGNIIEVQLQITQIIEVEYDYNIENNTVLVSINSDRELKNTKPTWTFSSDKKSYSKIFGENMNYTTTVEDINGIVINVRINITEIDDKAPEITQEQIHNDDGTITVILHSNERLGNTKPSWTLSKDELSYSKTFSGNIDYETSIQDIFGNEVWVKIKVLISNFEQLDESKYPGYKALLRQIQSQHPDWIITIKYTGLDWNTVVSNEHAFSSDGGPRSLTQSPYLNQWKDSEDNNKYDVTQSWYRASKSAIAYMMDPRNSLETAWIFQFQDLSSSAGTRANIKQMVLGTFLDTDSIIDTILSVAQEQGISPFHLVSRILQEQGRDGSGIMNGYSYNGRVVYNLFNINVSGNSSAGITAGAQYAYDRHWFTPETCIMGSAEFLKKNYISKGQSTLYYQRYNVVYQPLYEHQYMQNIRAANDEGNLIYQSYRDNGLLNSQFEFVIPVYENMPTTACPRPKT